MKSVKSILIATTLICASVVSGLSAQQAAQPAPHEFEVALGDSVMIRRECVEYSTGERPSVWVWDKVHTVRQLGTKKYSDGVLLMNIYSWICDTCLIPVNGRSAEAVAEAQAKQKAEREAWEKAMQEGTDPEAAARAAREAAEAEEAAAAEAARKAAEEEAAAAAAKDTVVAQEPVKADTVKEEEPAQEAVKRPYHRFTIGLRGGASSLLHNSTKGNWLCGGDVVLDLQYAHYWAKDGRPVDLGLIVGVGIGYAQSSLKADPTTDTTIVDMDNMNIKYNIRADEVKEHDGQLQLEVPLMFSLIHDNGFFLNVGPKFMLPVFTPYTQTVSRNDNTKITAELTDIGVAFENDEIMGRFSEGNYRQQGNDYKNRFTINVMLTAELGYEWTLKSGNSLGLGAFANYSVYNSFKNTPSDQLVQLTTQPTGTTEAAFQVNPATQTYAKGLGFFDAGIKLAYHFNFPKKRK